MSKVRNLWEESWSFFPKSESVIHKKELCKKFASESQKEKEKMYEYGEMYWYQIGLVAHVD